MGDDDVKRLILARRARFIATALAGLNAAMCGGTTEPQPCLSISQGDAGRDPDGGTPQPCLTPIQPEGGTDGGEDGAPQPCLSVPFDAGEDADGG